MKISLPRPDQEATREATGEAARDLKNSWEIEGNSTISQDGAPSRYREPLPYKWLNYSVYGR